MANLGNGGRTGNGGSNGLSPKSTAEQKIAKLGATKVRALQRELGILFPFISPITLSEFSRIYGSDLIKAMSSVDSTKGLKKYIHDHCKVWLKQNTIGVTGHVPASWGRLELVQSGKFSHHPKTKR